MTTPNILVSGSSSIMSSTERPESYQPHHSSLHLSSSSALSTSATTGNLAKEEEGGIVPAHSTSTNTDPPPTTTKKRKRALVTACLALPVAFYAVYGVVASTQDLIWLLRGDSTNDRQKDGVMTTSSSATGPGTSFSGRSDMFDGSITAETPAEHGASAQRPSNPLWSLLTAATFQQPSDGATLGLGSYLTNVVSPHSRYDPHSHLPVMWTPGAPNYGFVVTKMQRCLDVVQASWLGRTTEEEATYWDDIKVVDGNEEDRGRYLDIDMSSLHGIKRAKDQNLVDSGLADIIVSPFLPEVLDLFTPPSSSRHPRLMIILQDTKVRVKASYTYLHGQGLYRGPYLEFISGEHILANDYLVRMLSGKWDVAAELTHDDLHVAVQELQTKFHVGVQRHIQPFMEQMVALFGWQSPSANVVDCMFPAKFEKAHQPAYPQPKPEETELETQMRQIVRNKNRWDVQLLDIFVKRWDDGLFTK